MAVSVSDVLAAQRAFVADASHQLRNPLTALRIRLSNLEGHVDPDVQEQQAAALEEADRLNRILDELLAMARAESSSVDPFPSMWTTPCARVCGPGRPWPGQGVWRSCWTASPAAPPWCRPAASRPCWMRCWTTL